MSWLSKAVKKVSNVVKKVAAPTIAIVDPGVSLAGGYGKTAKKVAAGNIAVGAVGGAAIVAAPAVGAKLTAAAGSIATSALSARSQQSVNTPAPPVPEYAPPSVMPSSTERFTPTWESFGESNTTVIVGALIVVGLLLASLAR